MKVVLVVITLAIAGCATIPVRGPAGHVVLDEEHAMTTAYWKAAEDEVQAVDRQMAQLFAFGDSRISGMEGTKLWEYGVKYYGTVQAGRRVIVGKGVHISQRSLRNLQEENGRSGVIQFEAFGGGSLYFTVVYDVATKKVISVQSNAPL